MRKFYYLLAGYAAGCLTLGWLLLLPAGRVMASHSPTHPYDAPPQPTPDVLDVPVMPENPTEIQVGEVVYYYNCMPCHGDHGQGLTDEFRQIWVEDHQNCWARGCHAGRIEDEGFPIPRVVPAVSNRPDKLLRFPQPQDLFAYLERTHPPQNPGVLSEDDYWAVTALLLSENQRLALDGVVGPQEIRLDQFSPGLAVGIFAANSLIIAGLLIWQARRERQTRAFTKRGVMKLGLGGR